MTHIWQQIRLGKHVGFEEGESWQYSTWTVLIHAVWPLIVGQLDFKPS
jgi:hypothetical protein